MRYGSVCSGIEAASVAWEPLGWDCAFVAEVEKFPAAVLAHHYPQVPNLGDITAEDFIDRARAVGSIGLLVGGTPCQSFSIAGLRKGLADDRGNLALRFCQIVDGLRPEWVVWENVPGVLSSNGGRDFGAILGALVELGYGFAYRILDAQYFGVPQRRRRVFVVGHSGDWQRAAAVLFERHSLSGHPAPRREARQGATPLLEVGARTNGDGYLDGSRSWSVCQNSNGFAWESDIAPTVDTDPTKNTNQQSGVLVPPTANAVSASAGHHGHSSPRGDGSDNLVVAPQTSKCLNGHAGPHGRMDAESETFVATPTMQVRRLTPTECLRLQGFPDGWTKIPRRGKPAEDCPDGPQYRAIGNSMAVPVMRWIGERIDAVAQVTGG